MFCWNVDLQAWIQKDHSKAKSDLLLLFSSSPVVVFSSSHPATCMEVFNVVVPFPSNTLIHFKLFHIAVSALVVICTQHIHKYKCAHEHTHTHTYIQFTHFFAPCFFLFFCQNLDLFIFSCCFWTKLSLPSYQRFCLCWTLFKFWGLFFQPGLEPAWHWVL